MYNVTEYEIKYFYSLLLSLIYQKMLHLNVFSVYFFSSLNELGNESFTNQ